MMTDGPPVIPDTVPEVTVVLPLLVLQVPPGLKSVSTVVKPIHTVRLPDIASGNGLSVTIAVAIQPVDNV